MVTNRFTPVRLARQYYTSSKNSYCIVHSELQSLWMSEIGERCLKVHPQFFPSYQPVSSCPCQQLTSSLVTSMCQAGLPDNSQSLAVTLLWGGKYLLSCMKMYVDTHTQIWIKTYCDSSGIATAVMNWKSIHKEFKSRLNFQQAFYLSEQNLFPWSPTLRDKRGLMALENLVLIIVFGLMGEEGKNCIMRSFLIFTVHQMLNYGDRLRTMR